MALLPDNWPQASDTQRHPLDTLPEFIVASRLTIASARRELVIHAPDLDPAVLSDAGICAALQAFLLQNRHARIRLLLNSADNTRGSHRFIALARRLPSYVQLLRAQPEDQAPACWLLADQRTLVWRPQFHRYTAGYACADAALLARTPLRDFNERWERGQPEPQLRQLYL